MYMDKAEAALHAALPMFDNLRAMMEEGGTTRELEDFIAWIERVLERGL